MGARAVTHLKTILRQIIQPGFRQVYQPIEDGSAPPIVEGISYLAGLKKGMRLKPRWVNVRQLPAPPAGLAEGELIRLLQVHGIGRPSTYADTVQALLQRGYAIRNTAGYLIPTPRGQNVCSFLIGQYPALFDLAFTARMERRLDEMTRGRASYTEVAGGFWLELSTALDISGGKVSPSMEAK